MRKVVIHGPGGYDRLRLEDCADPRPAAGEVRIAVKHIGVNYADVVIRMGLYESAKKLVGWPITPGFEVAGVVDATGQGVDDLKLARDYLRTPRFNPLKLTTDSRSVLGFNLSFVSQRTDLLLPAMQKILGGFAEGWLKAPPVQRYPLAEVARAHADLESGQTVGKLVLEV